MTPLLVAQIVLTLFVFFMLLNSAAVMVYVERKVAALLQQRLGPYLVGPKGLLQPIADVIKLMFKEELRPKAADAFLFALAPIIAATCAFAAFAVVPFGADTTLFGVNRQLFDDLFKGNDRIRWTAQPPAPSTDAVYVLCTDHPKHTAVLARLPIAYGNIIDLTGQHRSPAV